MAHSGHTPKTPKMKPKPKQSETEGAHPKRTRHKNSHSVRPIYFDRCKRLLRFCQIAAIL